MNDFKLRLAISAAQSAQELETKVAPLIAALPTEEKSDLVRIYTHRLAELQSISSS